MVNSSLADRHLFDSAPEAFVNGNNLRVERAAGISFAHSGFGRPRDGKLGSDKRNSVFADGHRDSFRGCFAIATIAKAGRAASLPGGGASA